MTASLLHLSLPTLVGVRTATLIALLVIAAVIDVRTMRIPNWLTLSGATVGLAFAAAVPWQSLGPAWALDGLLWALGGLAAALAVLFPLYLLRIMGAGDVKLMAMVGAFLGLQQIGQDLLFVFVAGGAVAIGFAIRRHIVRDVATNVTDIVQSMAAAALAGVPLATAIPQQRSAGRLPYAVAICAGTLGWVALSGAVS